MGESFSDMMDSMKYICDAEYSLYCFKAMLIFYIILVQMIKSFALTGTTTSGT